MGNYMYANYDNFESPSRKTKVINQSNQSVQCIPLETTYKIKTRHGIYHIDYEVHDLYYLSDVDLILNYTVTRDGFDVITILPSQNFYIL